MTDTEIKVDKTTGEVKEVPSKYTLDYAFEQLEKIRKEALAFAIETREKISEIKSGGPGDVGAQAAGEALRALIQEQEQTFRRMIDFYIAMITDLSPTLAIRASDEKRQFLDFISDCYANCESGMELPDFKKIWKTIHG